MGNLGTSLGPTQVMQSLGQVLRLGWISEVIQSQGEGPHTVTLPLLGPAQTSLWKQIWA